MVNDPHVNALIFTVEHGPSIAYADSAPPIDHKEPGFRVTLNGGTVRLEFKEHYPTQEEALLRVRPYIQSWELDANLRSRPGDFRLRFERAEIIDRTPPPPLGSRAHNVSAGPIQINWTVGRATVTLTRPTYPSPPAGVTLKADDPDVETMHHRLSGYYEGREPLGSMASFCLSVLEWKFTRSRRRSAAKAFFIDFAVLSAVGDLTFHKGGQDSRKASGIGSPFSPKEERFLEAAVKQIIRRTAEVARSPRRCFAPIELSDLPDCP